MKSAKGTFVTFKEDESRGVFLILDVDYKNEETRDCYDRTYTLMPIKNLKKDLELLVNNFVRGTTIVDKDMKPLAGLETVNVSPRSRYRDIPFNFVKVNGMPYVYFMEETISKYSFDIRERKREEDKKNYTL